MRSVTTFDFPAFPAGVPSSLADAAGEHPALAVYVLGLAVMLAVLIGIALKWPRVFASVADELAVENRFDRRLLLGAVVVAWSIGWPVTLAVLAARAALRTVRGRR